MEYKSYDMTKQFEDLRLEAYQCSAGVWTIGYGHTKGVKPGDKITKKQAEVYLAEDIKDCIKVVERLVKLPLTQNRFDAVVDFIFNLGEGNFARSTMLRMLNDGDYMGAWKEFPKWNRARGKVLEGLVRRRKAEADLFMKP